MSSTEQQHTPEPWTTGPGLWPPLLIGSLEKAAGVVVGVLNADTGVGEDADRAEANARRIVAAINFCAGRSTEWLEPGGDGMTIYEGLDTIATDRVLLEAERDALQARLDALLAAAEPILNDLHTGWIANPAKRADTNRNAHERRLAAAIEAAKEVGA